MVPDEVCVVFVVEDFPEYAVCVPWSAGADEFTVGRAQRKQHGVVEFLVVADEVEFINENAA
jgi:hypothetical protein